MVSPDDNFSYHGDLAIAREEALEVLVDACQWRLTEKHWQSIDQTLTAMDAALKARDAAALATATADLEIAGPVRITKIGDPPVEPPAPVRDRMNRLVHSLGATQAPQVKNPVADVDSKPPTS